MMSDRVQALKKGIRRWLIEQDACHNEDCGDTKCDSDCPYLNRIVDEFVSFLASQKLGQMIDGKFVPLERGDETYN